MEIPPEVADVFLGAKNKVRVIVEFDNGKKVHRAIQRNKNGFCFIIMGKTTLKTVDKEAGLDEDVILTQDNSEFGMEVPEEFEEVLRQDDEGKARFMELNPGIKRSFLYYINTGRTVDTRIERSLRLIENLKNGIISAGNHDMSRDS